MLHLAEVPTLAETGTTGIEARIWHGQRH